LQGRSPRSTTRPPATEAADGPHRQSVVLAYYRAIAGYEYAAAYDLLGSTLRRGQTPARFTAGLADTAYVEAQILGVQPATGGASEVTVRVLARHNDRTIDQFAGTYTVGAEGGTPKLVTAAIRQEAAPAGVPPRCRPTDLPPAAGDAGASNRFATVTLRPGTEHEGGGAAGTGRAPVRPDRRPLSRWRSCPGR